ncbi:MAG: crossover junction endodeoxyribonuclease RuvC [Kiritimatiellaeota bacterium]|nr:crossover junction endodeoxyribonuclease RuvC [Kiritimatiellota bacterium]
MILGVDTSLRGTGIGVVSVRGNAFVAHESRTLHVPAGRPLSYALDAINAGITEAIERHHPTVAAIEAIFYHKYAKTAMLLGHARGVVIACLARFAIPVYEYEPRLVKQAVCGFGGASKDQIQRMIQSLLRLDALPPEDEADALALAICHHHRSARPLALRSEPL